jgi:hypothetical protein
MYVIYNEWMYVCVLMQMCVHAHRVWINLFKEFIHGFFVVVIVEYKQKLII